MEVADRVGTEDSQSAGNRNELERRAPREMHCQNRHRTTTRTDR